MAVYTLTESQLDGSWSYCDLDLLDSSSTRKIGTWTNNTGSTVTITAVTIRCGTGNGTFTQGTNLTGTGKSFKLKLKLGSVETESKTISNKVSPYNTGINPTQLASVTFSLNSPVKVTNGSSVTIYPKFVTDPGPNSIVFCAGASKWGCATNTGNTTHKYPTLTGSSGSIYVKVNGTWKLGIPYVKVNGTWESGIAYIKTSDGWKTL